MPPLYTGGIPVDKDLDDRLPKEGSGPNSSVNNTLLEATKNRLLTLS